MLIYQMNVRILRSAVLVSALSILTACGSAARHSHSTTNVPGEPSPRGPSLEIRNHDYFTILRVSDEPVALLNVRFSNPDAPLLSDLILEIQNVSDKLVTQVDYGMWPSEMCSDYMYALPPSSPNISYRDTEAGKQALRPNDKATINVSSDKRLRRLLDPKTYVSCPEAHKKPQLMIQEVHYAGGGVWYPNQKQREQSLRKYGASNDKRHVAAESARHVLG
jgi:hypothetical protein